MSTSDFPDGSSFDDEGTAGKQGTGTRAGTGSGRFFRGTELSKLLLLATLMIAGWALAWYYFQAPGEPAEEPAPAPRVVPSKVEPDRAPEFESVTDRTAIGLRDTAAFRLLLERARRTTAADLARQAHRDIYFTHLWERPEHYRGVPVHLLGTARRIIGYDSKLSPQGYLYEAWITTHDSQRNPYVCVFEDVPRGLPIGPEVSERVVFNGYFLKNMAYRAGDVPRGAPVLIGRIGWTPGPAPARDRSVFWMALVVAILFVASLFRWIAGLRRSLSPRSRAAALGRRPTEEIDPAALAEWVESVRPENDELPGAQ